MEILKTGFVKHLMFVALTSLCICAWTSEVHAQTKNTNDVNALRNIIATQKKKGAEISMDVNNKKQYKWDRKTGRLKTIQWCNRNLKGKISFSTLKGLKYLNVSLNKITVLDVDGITPLKVLNCSENDLKNIRVKSNKRLKVFDCSNNRLKKLKLDSYMKNLKELDCSYNRLKKLSLKNVNNVSIWCSYNQLKSLDFKKVSVWYLLCDHNRFEILNTYNANILDCSYNNIREIRGNFQRINSLLCAHNQLTKMDITEIDDGKDNYYTEVDCSYNKISELKVDFSKSLSILKCDHNLLTELEVQQPGRKLTKITCDNTLQFTGVVPEHWYDGVTGITVSSLERVDEGYLDPKIKNTARRWLLVPVSLMLEKKSGNAWKKMEFTRNTSLKTVLLIPKEKTATLDLSFTWEEFFGKELRAGKYRMTFLGKQQIFTVW